jgi:hypothetical protein
VLPIRPEPQLSGGPATVRHVSKSADSCGDRKLTLSIHHLLRLDGPVFASMWRHVSYVGSFHHLVATESAERVVATAAQLVVIITG